MLKALRLRPKFKALIYQLLYIIHPFNARWHQHYKQNNILLPAFKYYQKPRRPLQIDFHHKLTSVLELLVVIVLTRFNTFIWIARLSRSHQTGLKMGRPFTWPAHTERSTQTNEPVSVSSHVDRRPANRHQNIISALSCLSFIRNTSRRVFDLLSLRRPRKRQIYFIYERV